MFCLNCGQNLQTELSVYILTLHIIMEKPIIIIMTITLKGIGLETCDECLIY